MNTNNKQPIQTQADHLSIKAVIITLLTGLSLAFIGTPVGLDPKAWHLFAIFISCIVGIVCKLLPMGATAILALAIAMLTGTLGEDSGSNAKAALTGFSSSVAWLAVFAFFIARGFIKTGLGKRIAYHFIKSMGKSTLGLSYGLALTDLILAPAMPSITARGGGIIYPVVKALSESYGSYPNSASSTKIGSFLIQSAFQVNLITSAMFLTAMAGNPVAVNLLSSQGIVISWAFWAKAMIVPGLFALLMVPMSLYYFNPPDIKKTPNARAFANEALTEMGPMSLHEKLMLIAFIGLIVLWIGGSWLQIDAWIAAVCGVCFLLITGVLSYSDLLNEKSAWDTLIWMSILIILATYLNKLGFIDWMTLHINSHMVFGHWFITLAILTIAYFYTHYLFASASAHIAAMIIPFTLVAANAGVPAMVIGLTLCAFSNLYAGITHYGIGSAPIFFGSGYVGFKTWWRNGFFVSVINITIWLTIGCLWWKVIGIW
ncbi:putative malate transporter YflS [invertebrate metagenome]|uniref:Putative malate transporter YflS n=1 Tax=invertebrate metagenome TaxID=1711999 RepID=A0A2H9TAD7_9ZZZZ